MSDRLALFHRGRIEQVGTPAALYEAPASVFAATFLGSVNLLQGEAARRWLGAEGVFALRPEKIRLLPPDTPVPAGAEAAAGVIRDAAYGGPLTRYTVALDGGGTLVVVEQNLVAALSGDARGRRVLLVWERAQVRRLTASAT